MNEFEIKKVHAREVLDSRGNPTVECEVSTSHSTGRFTVPSGASTGKYEAVELRDGGKRYLGKGVLNAVKNIKEIIGPKVIGFDASHQEGLDKLMIELDGTPNKANLGANAILGVSIASAKAVANQKNIPLFQYLGSGKRIPTPMLNVINGGKHAGGKLAIQEFMILPLGFDTFPEAIRAASEVYHTLKVYLKKKYGGTATNVGDEGGFAPPIDLASDALDALTHAVNEAGYSLKKEFYFGLDAAASEFYKDGKYHLDEKHFDSGELVDYFVDLTKTYPALISLEDPFDENDFSSFSQLISKLPKNIAVVADDLTVTNVDRIKTAIDKNAMNYLLLKVNQIGTLTEAREAFDLTKSKDWGVVISHRSGETEDTFIADLAVGWGAERIKTGAPARTERVSKYNQLLRISELLADEGTYNNQA